jgi:hypothetical protein
MLLRRGDLALRNQYITDSRAAHIAERLTIRDQAILLDLVRVRAFTGGQLTRLHFSELAPDSRERTRRRVLSRLTELQVVDTLERTIGGARSGSAGHIYVLGIAAGRVLPLLQSAAYTRGPTGRARVPVTPGSPFLAHTLAISELYVALREHERDGELALAHFVAESAAWWPDGQGSVIKPDAYARLQHDDVEDCWWIEVDRATESIPTLRRKLLAYSDFARSGCLAPDEVVPRVLLTVPSDHRLASTRDLVDGLPAPGPQLILPTLHDQATSTMINILRG